MDPQSKKNLEFEFVRIFVKSLNPDLKDAVKEFEEPDAIIQINPLTGIEVTQVFNQAQEGELRVKFEGSWERIISNATSIWNTIGLPSAHVSVYFSGNYYVSKNNSWVVAENLVNFIANHIPQKGAYYNSSDSMNIERFGITRFSIERIINYDKVVWSYNDSIWVPNLEIDSIQEAIDKKEAKRNSYLKSCKKIWLLLVLNSRKGSGSFEIRKEVIRHIYDFAFDRVFIFESLTQKYFELHNEVSYNSL